ncbi:hypothetical protein CFOLD11_40600 [Clostridium folliculivorans]|uniref:Acyltransferase n=1 Tax=Clostridium folliculivorans TaxID=2886038 RepID=A0A9W5Y673_9CLOT|nr:hypothetical protein [Clostridium folliculivorans]GKU27233.1 hypothetical protein CFOLD11_40600 [Clostridium folliculivorans]
MKSIIKQILKKVSLMYFTIKNIYTNYIKKNNYISIKNIFIKGKLKIIGKNNIVKIDSYCNKLKININGNNNNIIITGNAIVGFAVEVYGDNNELCLLNIDSIANSKVIIKGKKCIVKISDGTTIGGCRIVSSGEENMVYIGERCMLSDGIEIWASDTHRIINAEDEQLINKAKDIIICNDVWIGQGVTILKGSKINAGSIVGMRAVVKKEIPEKSIYVTEYNGKIVKRNIKWSR